MISCVLLAAGQSARFGSAKPLALVDNQPVIEFILKALLKTRLEEVIVVLGSGAGIIRPHISRNPRVKSIVNKNFHSGQTSSFKTGLNIVKNSAEGILLLPVDTPFVAPRTIDALIEEFLKKMPMILLPVYCGRRGHPPVFSTLLRPEFKNLNDDQPLFLIQRAHQNHIIEFPVEDAGVIQSFNTPKELDALITARQKNPLL